MWVRERKLNRSEWPCPRKQLFLLGEWAGRAGPGEGAGVPEGGAAIPAEQALPPLTGRPSQPPTVKGEAPG